MNIIDLIKKTLKNLTDRNLLNGSVIFVLRESERFFNMSYAATRA